MTAAVYASNIASRVQQVRERIEAACRRVARDPEDVTLVAVSKTFPTEAVLEAYAAGIHDFGENRVQEALPKMDAVRRQLGHDQGPRFHLVGHLQSNKARAAAGAFDVIQSVDSIRLLTLLADAAPRPLPVFIEVNLAREPAKSGVASDGLDSLLAAARPPRNISLQGLMAVPPRGAHPEDSRAWFIQLRKLAARYELPALSMGMSDDFEVAIEEGATHVRVGRAIFGERNV